MENVEGYGTSNPTIAGKLRRGGSFTNFHASMTAVDILTSSLFKGDYFGEEGVMHDKSPWSYVAVTPVQCSCLTREKFLALLDVVKVRS